MASVPESPRFCIEVLEGLEPVRRRPAMFLGPLDRADLAADLAVEAARYAGHRTVQGIVRIRLGRAGRVSVEDRGRGLLSSPAEGRPGEDLPTVFGRLSHRRDEAASFWLGSAVLNAVSSRFVAESCVGGVVARLVWERGRQVGAIEHTEAASADGLRVSYTLDRELLRHPRLRLRHLLGGLRKASTEVPDVTFCVEDARRGPVRGATVRAGTVQWGISEEWLGILDDD